MKPIVEYTFRPMPDIWTDASTGEVLADVLTGYDIIIDDRCEFARFKDYDRHMYIWYRAGAGKITITIWPLD